MDLSRPDRRERLDHLAAQYALGTLSARARRRLATLARREPAVAEAIRGWELRLASLAEALPGVTPPLSVWNAISSRLGFASSDAGRSGPWWAKLALWRGLAVFSSVAAVVLGAMLIAGRLEGPEPTLVVVLAGQDARPALIATVSRDERELAVKAVGPVQLAPDRALELWALPEGAAPRSLGLIPAAGSARLALPAAALSGVPTLAVSLEPAGGSPTGAPTGPVLYTGRIERL
jgi:anti-sigma-K factor RskA